MTAQGKDLGIYSHVEAIKKPFLSRVFGDDSGNLYEGQISDFNDGLVSTFQVKTNELENDQSDLEAVVTALEADDAALWDALDAVIDMDAFLTFWAMEVLVGHWKFQFFDKCDKSFGTQFQDWKYNTHHQKE